ncbi:MAG TPA: hypothetical protein VMH37_01550 [Candidatus Binataceae bacterium]|nr:hypothetical protein [Candidatus Binataceae bacterium]
MKIVDRFKSQRGAVRLGLMDIVVTLILLGILVSVAYLQFPVYQGSPSAPSAPSVSEPPPQK